MVKEMNIILLQEDPSQQCALSWRIKHVGTKVWSGANKTDFERGHAA